MILTTKQLNKVRDALTKEPSAHEQKCFSKLADYLKREPTDQEIQNMKTDANLQLWVLTENQ